MNITNRRTVILKMCLQDRYFHNNYSFNMTSYDNMLVIHFRNRNTLRKFYMRIIITNIQSRDKRYTIIHPVRVYISISRLPCYVGCSFHLMILSIKKTQGIFYNLTKSTRIVAITRKPYECKKCSICFIFFNLGQLFPDKPHVYPTWGSAIAYYGPRKTLHSLSYIYGM